RQIDFDSWLDGASERRSSGSRAAYAFFTKMQRGVRALMRLAVTLPAGHRAAMSFCVALCVPRTKLHAVVWDGYRGGQIGADTAEFDGVEHGCAGPSGRSCVFFS